MGLLDRFKKKEDNFDTLPYDPDDPSLPPMPTQSGAPKGVPSLPPPPPPPQEEAGPVDLPELPPIPNIPEEGHEDLPPLPNPAQLPQQQQLQPIPQLPVTPGFPEQPAPEQLAMPQKRPKVFVQLNKYKDIVNTVSKMEGRINELQNAISKIKDIRVKESQLIDGWNNLLSEAKTRIDDVNNKLPSTEGL